MNKDTNGHQAEFIKRAARKLSREQGIPYHEALDKSATAAGFANWQNFINNAQRLPAKPARNLRIRSDEPIPTGILVRLEWEKSVGIVFKCDSSTVNVYGQWGPYLAARHEVVVCRDQSPALNFRPLRLILPYGRWTCADGSQVLFNRDYCPLWQKAKDGTVTSIDPNSWVEHDDASEEWFYADGTNPTGNHKKLATCLSALEAWGVETRRNRLEALLPAAIRSGNMDLLKGYSYNHKSAA